MISPVPQMLTCLHFCASVRCALFAGKNWYCSTCESITHNSVLGRILFLASGQLPTLLRVMSHGHSFILDLGVAPKHRPLMPLAFRSSQMAARAEELAEQAEELSAAAASSLAEHHQHTAEAAMHAQQQQQQQQHRAQLEQSQQATHAPLLSLLRGRLGLATAGAHAQGMAAQQQATSREGHKAMTAAAYSPQQLLRAVNLGDDDASGALGDAPSLGRHVAVDIAGQSRVDGSETDDTGASTAGSRRKGLLFRWLSPSGGGGGG
jgi:hypothetical protein